MTRKFSSSVVTANDLLSGEVLYIAPEGGWTSDHALAALFENETDANRALERASAQTGRVVGVYLAQATASDTGPTPTHFREAFRAKGPSNYDHGKQAEA